MPAFYNLILLLLICLCMESCNNGTQIDSSVPAENKSSNQQTLTEELPSKNKTTDWPCLHGPNHNSSSDETGLNFNWSENGPPELWSINVGTGYSTPVTREDICYNFHRVEDEEILSAVSMKNGEEIWSKKWPTNFECQFSNYSNGPYSTPHIDGDRIYCIGAEFRLSCLSIHDGSIIWEREIMQEFPTKPGLFAVGCGMCIYNNLLVINVGADKLPGKQELSDNGIVAFDKLTGKAVWQCTSEDRSYCTPQVFHLYNQDFLIVFAEKNVICLQPETGTIDWQVPFGAAANPRRVNATSPVMINDVLINVAGPNIGILCLKINPDRTVTELSRTNKILDSQYNNLIVKDHHVFGFNSSMFQKAQFKCLDIQGPSLVWEYESNLKRGMSIAVDNHLILLGELGHLAVLEFSTEKLNVIFHSSQPLLTGPCYSAPVVSRGKLLLKNEKQLKCFNLKN